ncbi:hypothetical protein PSECIP111951_00945 [Pseudoalteromonas holothuriae]|uniref:Uncharacterized protein n=1 Tax=Pseudoalteromonas holothuriae TaxID=2963714 RepID=A0A9W4VY67_9GAMM|nr:MULTISPECIES: hypothetical protein [unclassified Pseudoalteromonas]CAH9054035.1 hypothetical protein PSECIP111951_00945 [Pseudoalteromonas sp. CIP111951]CAH9055582.1 hypothetical protein PSECIP111854_01607 [Pseudoalteromonas sp. CIP111854]
MKKNFTGVSPPNGDEDPKPQEKQKQQPKHITSVQDTVLMLLGKWIMPTTVVLVLAMCISGYFLEMEAFTAIVGMTSPVVMALIMVIKEALTNDRDKNNRKK